MGFLFFGIIGTIVFIWYLEIIKEVKEDEKKRKANELYQAQWEAKRAAREAEHEAERRTQFKLSFEAKRLLLEMQHGRSFSDVEVHNVLTEEDWRIRESLR